DDHRRAGDAAGLGTAYARRCIITLVGEGGFDRSHGGPTVDPGLAEPVPDDSEREGGEETVGDESEVEGVLDRDKTPIDDDRPPLVYLVPTGAETLGKNDPAEDETEGNRGHADDLEVDAALALASPGHRLGNAESEREREIEVPLRYVAPDHADQDGDAEADGGGLCQ